MSPEQAQGVPRLVDYRTDLYWALAVITFEALTGYQSEFDSEALGDLLLRICAEPMPVPSGGVRHAVPAGFDAWFAKAANRDPSQRFGTATEMAKMFEEAVLDPSKLSHDSFKNMKRSACRRPRSPPCRRVTSLEGAEISPPRAARRRSARRSRFSAALIGLVGVLVRVDPSRRLRRSSTGESRPGQSGDGRAGAPRLSRSPPRHRSIAPPAGARPHRCTRGSADSARRHDCKACHERECIAQGARFFAREAREGRQAVGGARGGEVRSPDDAALTPCRFVFRAAERSSKSPRGPAVPLLGGVRESGELGTAHGPDPAASDRARRRPRAPAHPRGPERGRQGRSPDARVPVAVPGESRSVRAPRRLQRRPPGRFPAASAPRVRGVHVHARGRLPPHRQPRQRQRRRHRRHATLYVGQRRLALRDARHRRSESRPAALDQFAASSEADGAELRRARALAPSARPV